MDESLHITDPEFLEEQFSLREALAEGGDAAEKVAQESAARLRRAEEDVEEAFASHDHERIRDAVVRLCYSSRLDRIVRGVNEH